MKHRTGYGTFDLTRQIARRVQLEWDMVERPAPRPRFRDFPFADPEPPAPPAPSELPRPDEKRPLAA